ncbi:MAG: DUF799 domain-containing protein [Nitrosomonadales bacterium]|nr:DUF799 domain-containing protein [Nitrosomonadales bacterium]
MCHIYKWISLFLLPALLTACATPPKNYDYTAFRQSKPRSILVLPPLNNSPDIRATYSLLSVVTQPLAESGYYVFPVALVDQTFKENGLSNPEEMHQAPPEKLREIFGADATLYITVTQYGSAYRVVMSETRVTANAKLVDNRNGQLLWQGDATASDSEGERNNGGLVGMLVNALIKQIASNIGDHGRPIARVASYRLVAARPPNGLLHGPRSPLYEKD